MGGGDKAPMPYTPAHQAGADSAYYSTLSGLTPQDQQVYSNVTSGLNNVVQQTQNNPYAPQAQQGANFAADQTSQIYNNVVNDPANTLAMQSAYGAVPGYQQIYDNTVNSQLNAGAVAAMGSSGKAAGATLGDTFNNGQYATSTGSADSALGAMGTATGRLMYSPYSGTEYQRLQNVDDLSQSQGQRDLGNAQKLLEYQDPLMQYGFDPQGANYNYQLTQNNDSNYAQLAQMGLLGSPFAAGLSRDATAAFNRQWDADKFSRSQQAIAALRDLYSSSSALGNQGLQTMAAGAALPQDAYNTNNTVLSQAGAAQASAAAIPAEIAALQENQQIAAQDAQTRQALAAAQLQGTINDQQSSALGNRTQAGLLPASVSNDLTNQRISALNTATQGSMLPSQTYTDNLNNSIAALQAYTQGAGAASSTLQGDIAGYGNYMKLGQGAEQLAIDATKVNNSRGGFLSGLSSLFGTALSFIPGVGKAASKALG